ncbi:MAG: ammonium transporter [Armatimonadota bacterium]|nr:ammonium transporter [bacterium]
MRNLRRIIPGALVFVLGGIGGAVFAADPSAKELAAKIADQQTIMDTVWVMLTAFLVFWMQAGFAYVEGGLTRAKNTNNIMMKNLMDFCVGSLAYWVIGFGLMFGAGNAFVGRSGFFLIEKTADTFASLSWATVPLYAKFMFQLVFAATAATIVSGAMAERTKFNAYLIYSAVISAFIYPVVGHWIWGGGWLANLGFWDFAGSTVVHSTGAWMALIGAWFLGPRIGKFRKDGKANAIPGHNLPMAALGVFILWLGWFGFNPGSTMAANASIAHISTTTNLAAAIGAITAMVTAWILFKKPDVSMTLNGVLAGLVAITAPCAFVSPASSIVIGGAAGILVVLAVVFFDKIHLDDPVGAVSVHGICGSFGTLCLGLFAQDKFQPGTTGNGLFFGGGSSLLLHQAIGVISVFGFVAVCGVILFGLLRATVGLRVTADEEIEGLDIGEHGMSAYPDFEMAEKNTGAGLVPEVHAKSRVTV